MNSQWRDYISSIGTLGLMIPIVDFSIREDMNNYSAYAMSCLIAEKSVIGKRVLSFRSDITWHNLEGCHDFVDMMEVLYKNQENTNECEFSNDFYNALHLIIDAIIEKKMEPDQIKDMTFAIFSDMQIEPGVNNNKTKTLFKKIEEMYSETGIKLHGKPLKPPHILFWNLRSTNGFPCLSNESNVTMMSGFNPILLNIFCEKGMEVFRSRTPWSQLIDSMRNQRYQCLEDRIKQEIYT